MTPDGDPAAGGPETQRDPVGDVPPPGDEAPETVRARIGRALGEWGIFAAFVLGIYLLLAYNTARSDGTVNFPTLLAILVPTLIYGLFALGLNLQFGFTGLINFGHVGSMVVGAYTAAVVSIQFVPGTSPLDLPAWVIGHSAVIGFLCGVAAAVGFGLLVGLPTLRLREDYLAIVTIGAAEIIRIVINNADKVTGGTRGLLGYERFGLWWISSTDPDRPLAFLGDRLRELAAANQVNPYELLLAIVLLAVIILVMLLYEGLTRAPYGRVLKAIRDDEEVAASVGKNVFVYKLQVLVLGSMVGAMAGVIYAWRRGVLSPDTEVFGPIVTFFAWIAVIVGGAGNNKGTLLGAVFLWTVIFEGTRYAGVADHLGLTPIKWAPFRFLFIGMLLIAIILLRPQGVLGRKEEMVFGK